VYGSQPPYGYPASSIPAHPGAPAPSPAPPVQIKEINVQFAGAKLANKDILSKSDPFLIIYKKKTLKPDEKLESPPGYHGEMVASEWVPVHKTEVVKDNLNPTWKPFKLDVEKLGGMNAPIIVEVIDWDSSGSNDFIGRSLTSLNELKVLKETILLDPKKKGSFRYANSGRIMV